MITVASYEVVDQDPVAKYMDLLREVEAAADEEDRANKRGVAALAFLGLAQSLGLSLDPDAYA